jgi:hypothetical protein
MLVLGLIGCGGSSDSSPATSAPATTPSGLTVELTIVDGVAKSTNSSYDASVGQPITVRVTSDADDELHVHSVPDHSFEVKPAPNQTFNNTVDVPGREVELHHLNVVVATINVR